MAKFAHSLVAVLLALTLVSPEALCAQKKKRSKIVIKSDKIVRDHAEEDRSPVVPKMPKDFQLLQEGEIPLKADGAIVLDGYTGKALYEKNADVPQYPASTTKVMTALLIIEAGDLDHEVIVTEEDAKVPESSLEIKTGEHYTRRQMLYGLMLKSANDVAHALGRDNAGTIDAFAAKMNQRARELGATNTSFRNPNGLHDPAHFTTPRDLATIARAAMQQPFFRTLVSTVKFPWVRATPAAEVWELTNHNRLLTRFEGCTGVKTGYTNPAQHTLVTAAISRHREVISTVMHDGKLEKWEDSMLLLTYGFDHPPDGAAVKTTSAAARAP